MLSVKPWKPEAVARLLLSIVISVFAGSLVMSILHHVGAGMKTSPRFFAFSGAALVLLSASLLVIRSPWTLENFVGRVLRFMISFYAAVFFGILAQTVAGRPGPSSAIEAVTVAALSFQGAGLILIGRFLRAHQMTWAEAFGFSNHWPQAALMGVVSALIFVPIGWGLQRASMELMERIPHHPIEVKEQQAVHALRVASSWFDRVALGVAAILLAPLAEEMIFRGILYPLFRQWGFRLLALWITSLLFAAVHMNLSTFIPLLVLSLILTLLYEKTDNLLAPIIAHALFNGFNFLMLYLVEKQLG